MNQQGGGNPPDAGPPRSEQEVDDGVDVSLIRWLLSLSPAERLETLQGFVDAAMSSGGASASA